MAVDYCKSVYLKFSHSLQTTKGNHYDAIIKEKVKDEVICMDGEADLQMSSSMKTEKVQKVDSVPMKKTKVKNKQVFNFPASNSKVTNTQTVNAEMDIGHS